MAETSKKSQQPPQPPRLTRRAHTRKQRERQRQRLVIISAAIAVGLALVSIVVGLGYEQVWKPSRPVAQVGDVTLTRSGYWTERRNEIARRMAQNLQLLELFGAQFSSQIEGQFSQLDGEIPNIRSAPVDDATVSSWADRQIIAQSAGKLYNIQASDGEIAQQLMGDLGHTFAPPPPPPTNTASLTPTATLSATAALPAAVTAAPIATAAVTDTLATPAPGGPTATTGPTSTPPPTETPTATPQADAALSQQEELIGRVFDSYQSEMLKIDPQSKAHLTIDDFKTGLHDQYQQQVVTRKVEEQLVPEASFTPTTDPSSITVRQILITITATLSDTQQVRDAAYAARKPEAEAILAQLRGGADFATLAKEKSGDFATKQNGGELPSFDKDGKTQEGTQIDPAIVKAALALKENEISDLIQTPFGWHIIQLTARKVDSKADQLQAARTKAFDEWLAQQRAATTVQHFPPITPSPSPLPTGTALPLPTAVLGATPTATAVPTGTTTLTGTATLPLPTTPATTATAQPSPSAPAAPASTAAPTALPPSPTETPKP